MTFDDFRASFLDLHGIYVEPGKSAVGLGRVTLHVHSQQPAVEGRTWRNVFLRVDLIDGWAAVDLITVQPNHAIRSRRMNLSVKQNGVHRWRRDHSSVSPRLSGAPLVSLRRRPCWLEGISLSSKYTFYNGAWSTRQLLSLLPNAPLLPAIALLRYSVRESW